MNAILRECEAAAVLTNEAIEVHLSYLRPAVEALIAKIDQGNKDRIAGDAMLAEKIDRANQDRIAGDTMLAQKIDQANQDRIAGDNMLAEKIDQANQDRITGDNMLAQKIDQANQDRIAGDNMLAQKIDHATDRISKVQGSIDGLKWFIASIAVILSGLSIAHTFGWI